MVKFSRSRPLVQQHGDGIIAKFFYLFGRNRGKYFIFLIICIFVWTLFSGTLTGSSDSYSSSTPLCKPHATICIDLCEQVSKFVKGQRESVRSNPASWLWYYQGVLDYYRCVNATKIVEVGAAWGAQTAYHLKHGYDIIQQYHVVDPFLAGYDKDDPMSALFSDAAPGASPEDISVAWYQSISKELGVDGHYLGNITMPPAGCKLRIHRLKSTDGAKLFHDHSVDVVFIDGLHTYEGVKEDIKAWRNKIRIGGSLIFNDYQDQDMFPGIARAVDEEAKRQRTEIKFVDATNALIGGNHQCAKGPRGPGELSQ